MFNLSKKRNTKKNFIYVSLSAFSIAHKFNYKNVKCDIQQTTNRMIREQNMKISPCDASSGQSTRHLISDPSTNEGHRGKRKSIWRIVVASSYSQQSLLIELKLKFVKDHDTPLATGRKKKIFSTRRQRNISFYETRGRSQSLYLVGGYCHFIVHFDVTNNCILN